MIVDTWDKWETTKSQKEIEDIKKNHMEISELKNTTTKTKQTLSERA